MLLKMTCKMRLVGTDNASEDGMKMVRLESDVDKTGAKLWLDGFMVDDLVRSAFGKKVAVSVELLEDEGDELR